MKQLCYKFITTGLFLWNHTTNSTKIILPSLSQEYYQIMYVMCTNKSNITIMIVKGLREVVFSIVLVILNTNITWVKKILVMAAK